MQLDDKKRLLPLIEACKKGERRKQDELYRILYSYGMSICLRYSQNKMEAHDILNDGFIKIFTYLNKYTPTLSFKAWTRRIFINAAIDYYRHNQKHQHTLDIAHAHVEYVDEDSLSKLSAQEIMKAVQELPPSYRIVFNLYAIEGYKHHEIATKLGINEGTSKSSLSKARVKLKKILSNWNQMNLKSHG